MRKNKKNYSVLLIAAVGVIIGLIYYIRNKNRIDYETSKAINEEAGEATKQYYNNGIADLKAVWSGKKNYFG